MSPLQGIRPSLPIPSLHAIFLDNQIKAAALLIIIYILVRPRDERRVDGMAVDVPPSPRFPFNELIEDCVNLILTDYLDLPTLLSYGYTSKSAISRVKNVLVRGDYLYRFERFLPHVVELGYYELLKFFIVEIPSYQIGPGESSQMTDLILSAVEFGHVEVIRRYMTAHNCEIGGLFSRGQLRISVWWYYPSSDRLQAMLVKSNSPAMYDLFIEMKVKLKLMDVCYSCIEYHKVELLRHIFPQLDDRAAFDFLCEVPRRAVSTGAIDILEIFVKEMWIQMRGNEFIVAFGGQSREVPFAALWLEKHLLKVVTWLESHGIHIEYFQLIGYHLLRDSDPGFLDYLEQKGIDYRDLVAEVEFEKLFSVSKVSIDHKWQRTFYDKVFRDPRILEKLTGELTEHLIKFIGRHATKDPGVFLPLVRSIYNQAPLRHTLPHPFDLMLSIDPTTEEVMGFLLKFTWTSEINLYSFFSKLEFMEPLEKSKYRPIIIEFLAKKKRGNSGLRIGQTILLDLMGMEAIPLKDLSEILLALPPLRKENIIYDLRSSFLNRRCESDMDIDSFVAVMKWLQSEVGDFLVWSDPVGYMAVCHENILPCLLDLGQPMPAKSSLAVLCLCVLREDLSFPHRTEKRMKAERTALRRTLQKLRVLKQHGADFPQSLLRDAFDFTRYRPDCESAVFFSQLFCHSEEVKSIFDFLIDDCGCSLHANVLLAAISIADREIICRDGTIRTLKYLINRQCPSSKECMSAAISRDRKSGDSFYVDMLTSKRA